MEIEEKKVSNFTLNKLEKTNFNHIESYPVKGGFSIIAIEIKNVVYYLVRGIKNKCFYEGIFKEKIKAIKTIEEMKKG